jgi:hypothetical protein
MFAANSFYPATKTMELFNECIERDQGASYRVWLGKVLPHIEDAYRAGDGGFRTHLGISLIGDECSAKLFYGWRWTKKPKFNGQTLRLFNRGHLEEGRFVALILASGMQIVQQDETGGQYRVSYLGGHFGSAIDGVVIGCPDMPNPSTPILTEMKTHNDNSFKKLKTAGVKESKWEHYVQQQEYMLYYGLPASLYIAVNKNTDEIWCEIVPFDRETAERYKDRGHIIALSETPPPKLSQDRSFYKCKWCDYRGICHMGDMPEVNCRTCKHSYPLEDGTWRCGLQVAAAASYITDGSEGILDKEAQLAACANYEPADYYG